MGTCDLVRDATLILCACNFRAWNVSTSEFLLPVGVRTVSAFCFSQIFTEKVRTHHRNPMSPAVYVRRLRPGAHVRVSEDVRLGAQPVLVYTGHAFGWTPAPRPREHLPWPLWHIPVCGFALVSLGLGVWEEDVSKVASAFLRDGHCGWPRKRD